MGFLASKGNGGFRHLFCIPVKIPFPPPGEWSGGQTKIYYKKSNRGAPGSKKMTRKGGGTPPFGGAHRQRPRDTPFSWGRAPKLPGKNGEKVPPRGPLKGLPKKRSEDAHFTAHPPPTGPKTFG